MKNLGKLLVFFSICVFILTVWQIQGEQMKNTEAITIKILIENGNVICDPDPAEAEYGDTVIWISDYDFTVEFVKTPFKEKKFKADKKDKEKWSKSGIVTTKEAKEKKQKIRFKYSVEVIYEGESLTVDPDLDIKP